jgi:preprotein translocase subunit SecG
MEFAVYSAMVLLSLLLMVVVLLQTKGSGFSGAFGGSSSSIYRTRRGLEKTLYQFTIGIAVVFVLLAIVADIVL